MKVFICDCVDPIWPVQKLCETIDKGKRIAKKKFFDECIIDASLERDMAEYPRDYKFYKAGEILFYEHSRIEHFFMEANYERTI
jgi:hypothetical protein